MKFCCTFRNGSLAGGDEWKVEAENLERWLFVYVRKGQPSVHHQACCCCCCWMPIFSLLPGQLASLCHIISLSPDDCTERLTVFKTPRLEFSFVVSFPNLSVITENLVFSSFLPPHPPLVNQIMFGLQKNPNLRLKWLYWGMWNYVNQFTLLWTIAVLRWCKSHCVFYSLWWM